MKLKHPITSAEYELLDDGTISVTEVDGRHGRFDVNGRHLEGELRIADPHILDWVGMTKLPSRRSITPAD
jgi:hypothetical protein